MGKGWEGEGKKSNKKNNFEGSFFLGFFFFSHNKIKPWMSPGFSIFKKTLDIWWRKSIKNTGYMQDFQ